LKYLKIDSADVLGYSMGAAVALQFVIRHPSQVRKVISISGSYSDEGLQPSLKPLLRLTTPASFESTIYNHASSMFKKLGGNVMGDLVPMPKTRMAVLPHTSHVGMMSRLYWINPMVIEFLDDAAL
jgi:pimeloyl-ACP methyl ester carboxylesterase